MRMASLLESHDWSLLESHNWSLLEYHYSKSCLKESHDLKSYRSVTATLVLRLLECHGGRRVHFKVLLLQE